MTSKIDQATLEQDGWTKPQEAEYYEFKNIGDQIKGVLLEKARSEKYNVGLYRIQQPNGVTLRFLGKQQLDGLLEQLELGTEILVTYIDSKNLPEGELMIFDVFWRPLKE